MISEFYRFIALLWDSQCDFLYRYFSVDIFLCIVISKHFVCAEDYSMNTNTPHYQIRRLDCFRHWRCSDI